MVFDRVLPRPAALYDETNTRIHGPSSLLDHKIMKDPVAKASSQRPESESCSSGLAQMQLSSLNRERFTQNHGAESSPHLDNSLGKRDKTSPPSSGREQSPIPSPIKSAPPRTDSGVPFCLCQPDPKIPRPRNAFILFRQHYQASVVAQNPGLANPEISKIIGEQWRALPNDIKEQWKALAEAEKARHQQQYPDYRYQPRRVGRDGYLRHGNGTDANGSQNGSSICSRCGGRPMNPPSTPNTPILGPLSSRSSHAEPTTSAHNGVSNRNMRPNGRRDILTHDSVDPRRRASLPDWNQTEAESADTKRRRLNRDTLHRQSISDPVSHSILSPRQSYSSTQSTRARRPEESATPYDPSLTLPPLKNSGNTPSKKAQDDVEAMVMSLPVLYRIRALAKISPPLARGPNGPPRGAVIAVEGQESTLVNTILKHLGSLLIKDGNYAVRVFEGPDIRSQGSKSGQMGDATLDYLNVISAWHRISNEIVQFVSSKAPRTDSHASEDDNTAAHQPDQDSTRKDSKSPRTQSNGRPSSDQQTKGAASPLPVALVPRYQLTTADAFACSTPISDCYAPIDHWQWMASLWRACVGPDITIHIRECDQSELDQYGPGNPVEIRLNDARTLIVRRARDSPREIEEKALRRIGFEIEDYLRG